MDEITRRYFILNGFDGALTVLGIILGSSVAHVVSPVTILGAGIGASVAMGFSGLFAAYMTEAAETSRRMQRLERAMLSDLDGTVIAEASRRHIFEAALIDGLSPLLTTLVCLVPYMLALWRLVDEEMAFTSALGVNVVVLALLGAYLGRISRGNALLYAGLTIVLGLSVALITIWLVALI